MLGYCGSETVVPYLVAAGATGAFGLTAFVLWTRIDTELAEELDGDLRVYAITRLLARVMNAVSAVFGFLHSNAVDFGWADAQRDFDVLQAMGTAHMAWSVATLAVETANTVLVF